MRHRSRSRTAVVMAIGLTAAWLVGCGGGYSSSPTATNPGPRPTPAPSSSPTPTPNPMPSATPTPAPAQSTVVIDIVAINGNMSFRPATASLRVGQQVRWHNAHTDTHTATQDGGGLDTGLIRPGATSAPITVTAPGTLRYHCEIHPVMVGALVVTQ
jgi:plastocyanin